MPKQSNSVTNTEWSFEAGTNSWKENLAVWGNFLLSADQTFSSTSSLLIIITIFDILYDCTLERRGEENPQVCGFKPVWASLTKCWMWNHAKNHGDKKKMFPDFGLPWSALYSVKQQTTVIYADRLCLSSGTAESHTKPQHRDRETLCQCNDRRETPCVCDTHTFVGPCLSIECIWFLSGSLLSESPFDSLFNSASLWRSRLGQADSLILYLSLCSRCDG